MSPTLFLLCFAVNSLNLLRVLCVVCFELHTNDYILTANMKRTFRKLKKKTLTLSTLIFKCFNVKYKKWKYLRINIMQILNPVSRGKTWSLRRYQSKIFSRFHYLEGCVRSSHWHAPQIKTELDLLFFFLMLIFPPL